MKNPGVKNRSGYKFLDTEMTATGKRKAGLLKDTNKGKKSKKSKDSTNMLGDGLDDLMLSRLSIKNLEYLTL
jgi:hypothetical protein